MARRRVGYIGEGAFSKRLPYVAFFWYFSWRKQEKDMTELLIIKRRWKMYKILRCKLPDTKILRYKMLRYKILRYKILR